MRIWIVVATIVLLVAATGATAAGKEAAGAGTTAGQQAAPMQAAPASAGSTAAGAAPMPQPEEIVAGGIIILRLRVTVAGMTPTQRMGAIYERINTIISDHSVRPADVRAVKKGNDWLVMAGPYLFVTVTDGEAKANKAAPRYLAEIWASNLRIAIPIARPSPVPPVPAAAPSAE